MSNANRRSKSQRGGNLEIYDATFALSCCSTCSRLTALEAIFKKSSTTSSFVISKRTPFVSKNVSVIALLRACFRQ
jgi:hypothetical protein